MAAICGIVGTSGTGPAAPFLLKALHALEYRGYDSAGMATATNEGLYWKKGVGKVAEVEKDLKLSELPGTVGIAHSRWATHGGVTGANAHPHLDCSGKIAVVHNGIIDNFQALKADLLSRGHRFYSETDTEVIPHLLDETHGSLAERVLSVAKRLEGDFAFLALDSTGNLVGARRGLPLLVGRRGEEQFVASDLAALPPDCEVWTLGDEEIALLGQGDPIFQDLEGHRLVKSPVVWSSTGQMDISGQLHHTAEEIFEQPRALSGEPESGILAKAADMVRRARQVVFTASGSSYHACILGRYYLAKVVGRTSEVLVASDFTYLADDLGPGTLLIAVSQSGETADVVQGVKLVRAAGVSVLSLINRPYTLLHSLSDLVLPLGCGPEYGVAATKSFTAQVATLYCLAHAVAGSLETGRGWLDLARGQVVEALNFNDDILWELAWRLVREQHIYCLARGVNVAVAQEGALKLKEVGRIHAEAMAAGELKHGSLALIGPGTPVLMVCPSGLTLPSILANAEEVKARGAQVIGISDIEDPVFDWWLRIPTLGDGLLYPLTAIIPFQLLSYHMACVRLLDPDRPKNLAKTVTVK